MTLTKFFSRATHTGDDKHKKNRWVIRSTWDPNALVPEKRKGISIDVQPIKKVKASSNNNDTQVGSTTSNTD